MKFAVGHQLPREGEEPFAEVVADYADAIAEVYFPWPDMPSGRASLPGARGHADSAAQRQLERDLAGFRRMGLKLDVLFNANCYGRHAMSRRLANQVVSVLDRLGTLVGGVEVVTTTSPVVARTVKDHCPSVEVRASVNMRIGTVRGMEYVADLFDAYCVQREHNRDLDALAELRAWADAQGKRLHLLANSGCLAFCSGQTFHDNLVAHDREIDRQANIDGWGPHVCWGFFRERANWPAVLANTWIRPEDLHRYEGMFDVVKLATRIHERPRAVIDAYTRARHHGNLLDLLEPTFSRAFAPFIIDNDRFPEDWFERTGTCGRQCHRCDYCRKTLGEVLVRADQPQPAAT